MSGLFITKYKETEGLDIREEGLLKNFAGVDIAFDSAGVEIYQTN